VDAARYRLANGATAPTCGGILGPIRSENMASHNDEHAYLRHPMTGVPLTLAGDAVRDVKGNLVATYRPADHRYDWLRFVEYGRATEAVKAEIQTYDAWASKRLAKLTPSSLVPRGVRLHTRSIDQDPLYRWNRNLAEVVPSMEVLFSGGRILDIGGSCIDAWRMLLAGAARIDQVEPSAVSQVLGLKRLQAATGWDRRAVVERVFFHTALAEHLPFRDACFDVVFSRSSIHHTRRELALPEIRRVLAPGGVFLCIEPLQTVGINRLMHATRRMRRVDRGSDDPLTPRDLALLGELFREVVHRPRSIAMHSLGAVTAWAMRRSWSPAAIRCVV